MNKQPIAINPNLQSTTLVLERSLKRKILALLFLIGVLVPFSVFLAYSALQIFSENPSGHTILQHLQLFASAFVLACLTPYLLILQLLPGQGNLRLTPEGFEIISRLKKNALNHRWQDVTGFYVTNVGNGRYTQSRICFDLTGLHSFQRRKVIPYDYELSHPEVVDILNQWKQTYAPNPEGISFNPRLTPSFGFWKDMGLRILVLCVMGSLILLYFFLFAKTRIQIVNQTGQPVSDILLDAYTLFPKDSQTYFQGINLQLGQNTSFSISHFDDGYLRLFYRSKAGTGCAYLKHTQCVWHSGDSIVLEPDGQLNFQIPHCTKRNSQPDMIETLSCPQTDSFFRAKGFSPVSPTAITLQTPHSLTPADSSSGIRHYIQTFSRQLKPNWHPPLQKQSHLITSVRFRLHRSGRITNLQILRSSGHPDLDESCLQAIRDTSPLPPLPASLKGESIPVEFTFDYFRQNAKQKPKP